jgi:hypothetical protein
VVTLRLCGLATALLETSQTCDRPLEAGEVVALDTPGPAVTALSETGVRTGYKIL